MKKNNNVEMLKKFWDFVWNDNSFYSYVVNFVLALIIIKFIFFPGLGLLLGTDFPIVAIVTGSMEHKIVNHNICGKTVQNIEKNTLSLEEWKDFCFGYYKENYNFTYEEFENFDYKNGLNIGDVIVIYGKKIKNIEVGEVLIFVPEDKQFFYNKGPVIHRIVKIREEDGKRVFETKGDHNSVSFEKFEKNITEDDVIGVAMLRVPYIGYVKIIFVEIIQSIVSLF